MEQFDSNCWQNVEKLRRLLNHHKPRGKQAQNDFNDIIDRLGLEDVNKRPDCATPKIIMTTMMLIVINRFRARKEINRLKPNISSVIGYIGDVYRVV
jgi:hypothetical protein